MPRSFLFRLAPLAVLLLAGCMTADRADGPPAADTVSADSVAVDLTGIPLSKHLEAAVSVTAARPHEEDPASRNDLADWDRLEIAIQRPASRQEAGAELYARWQEQPRSLLWLQTAIRYEYLLHRADELTDRVAALAPADSAHPVACFARGCQNYGYGSRGEHFRQAALRATELDSVGQVLLTQKLAMVDSDQGDNLAAVDRLLATLPAARLGGRRLEMRHWFHVARYLRRADRLDDALHAAAVGLRLCHRTGSPAWRGKFMILLAGIRESRRENGAALALLEAAVRLGESADLPWIFLDSNDRAACLCSALGDPRGAMAYDRRALAHSLAVDDSLNAPRNLMNVAYDFRLLGQLDSCLVYMQEARRWVEAFDDARNKAMLPFLEAEYFCQVGDYATADSLLAVAQARSSQASLAVDEARMLLGLIRQGLEMGQPDLAYRAIERLTELRSVLHDEQPDQNLVADFEIATADFLAGQGEFVLAREALDRAREAVAAGGGENKAWDYHRSAGELALRRDDLPTARAEFEQCLELARQSGNPDQQVTSRFHLGHSLLRMQSWDEARQLFAADPDTGRYGGRFRTRLSALVFQGRSFSLEGKHLEALAHLRRAESLLTPYSPPELAAQVQYELARSLAATGRPAAARAALLAARGQLAAEARAIVPELKAFTEEIRRDVTEALVDLYLGAPDLAPGGEAIEHSLQLVLGLREQDRAAGRPQDGSCLAVFFVGRENSYLWVGAGEVLSVHRLPGRDELSRRIAPVLADLSTPGRAVDAGAAGALASLLLDEVLPSWPEGGLLRISSDDLLHALPWSALPLDADGTPALERGPIAEMAGGKASAAPAPTPRTLLAVGLDSHAGGDGGLGDLRHAEAEAAAVAALWPAGRAVLRTGSEASWAGVLATGLDRVSALHLATHAVVHQGASKRASLRLAGPETNTPLTLRSIADLNLQADLIYLSCCEGARLSRGGAGLTGFARAFLAAGARTVIASSIRVDDEASLALARNFYGHWLAGKSKAAALRAAQLELRAARPKWRHPFYWSFYRIIGAAG